MSRRLTAFALTTALLALLVSSQPSRAQRVNLAEMKAAYLLNFMRFAEWPAGGADGGETTLCIVNDHEIAGVLEQLVKGRALNDAPYVVHELALGGNLRPCRLIYAAHIDATGARSVIDAVRGAPTLTISDYPQFAQLGGIANFYLQDDALRFALNLDAARRAQMHLSARLLSVGTVVKEDSHAAR